MRVIWTAWMALIIAITAPIFYAGVGSHYGRPLGQALFFAAFFALLACVVKFRRGRTRAYEIPAIAALIALPPLLFEPRATLFTAVLFAAAAAAGSGVCRWMKLPGAGIAITTGIGFGLVIGALIALGVAGLLRPTPIAGLLLGCFAIGWRGLFAWRPARLPDDPVDSILVVFVVIFACSAALVYLTPSVMYDSLATHLAAARVFASGHQLRPVRFLDYSIFPQGFELLMAAGYIFAGQMAAQMVAPVFLALTLLALFATARELGADWSVALAAAVLACSLPFLQWTGCVVKNDIPVAFFQIAALAAWLKWPATKNFRWVVAAAFLGAISLNIKDTALLSVGPLGLLCAYAAWRQPRRLRALVMVAGVFVVFGSFWFARSLMLTGHPIYPYTAEVSDTLLPLSNPWSAKMVRWAELPWSLHFHGDAFFDGQSRTPLGAFFLLFSPALLGTLRKHWTMSQRAAAIFVALTFLLSLQTWIVVRFVAAAIAVSAVGIVLVLANAWRAAPRWFRAAIFAAGLYSLIFDWSIVAALGTRIDRVRYLAGRESREMFLLKMEPMYSPLAWLHEHADPDALILGVDEWDKAYAPDPEQLNSVRNHRHRVEYIRQELASRPYRYLILPEPVRAADVFGGADPTPCYSDPQFSIFKLP